MSPLRRGTQDNVHKFLFFLFLYFFCTVINDFFQGQGYFFNDQWSSVLFINTTVWNQLGGVSVREYVEEYGLRALLDTVRWHWMTWGDRPRPLWLVSSLRDGSRMMSWTVNGHTFLPSPDCGCHVTCYSEASATLTSLVWRTVSRTCEPEETLCPLSCCLLGYFYHRSETGAVTKGPEGATNWSRQKTFSFSGKQISIHS